ncbi:MAG: hypothetical protein PF638_03155 [Candidatus Delongbacteria bacterium]|jgi:hypothetical protein|nr:hypothetical protein [Candidatus Delongbacteria bacterium]
MQRIFTVIMILIFAYLANAELSNINPDPTGEPWIVGGISSLTPEQQEKVDAIPVLELPDTYAGKELPPDIDNSQQPYFRDVFNQEGGSCGQASGVGYAFTYEMNFERGTSANVDDNR